MKIAAALVFLLSASATAQITSARPYLFVPADSVLVGIDTVSFNLSMNGQLGADPAALRAHTEERIRQAGLTLDGNAIPRLAMQCVVAGSQTVSVWSCGVQYRNVVDLHSPRRGMYLATVWESTNRVEAVGPRNFSEALTRTIDAVIDEFLHAWRKANPHP